MSLVFHGVVVRSSEPKVRALFASLNSYLPLRLVRLDDGVFGVYAKQHGDAPDELRRIAALLSQVTGTALFYWDDTRVGSWFQFFKHGRMTRELDPCNPSRKSWGKGDPLEAIGVSKSLHKVVEEAFLWDLHACLADNRPGWEQAKQRFPVGRRVFGTVAEHLQHGGVFVDLGDLETRGFIDVLEFLDDADKVTIERLRMAPELFPPVGTWIQAVVLGHSDERQKLVLLGVKPSQLRGSAEPAAAADRPRD